MAESETKGPTVNDNSAMARKGDQDTLPKAEDFQAALDEMLVRAQSRGDWHIDVRSRDLHRLVGGYPGRDQRPAVCWGKMRGAMGPGDEGLPEPPGGQGATLLIRYRLPG